MIDAGRQWYEIWVPHNPADWKKPKIVFPDIAEEPRFFLDTTGAVVNGDCYWITLRDNVDEDWLYLILAVANSPFITRYYDVAFHNKLYAGRRRFQTQFVRDFPLPHAKNPIARKLVSLVKTHLAGKSFDAEVEREIGALVYEAFGLVEEISR